MRTTLGVIAGFVVWSVLWLCANYALRSGGMLPASQTAPITAATPVLALLIVSTVCSVIAGYTAARVAHVAVAAVFLGVVLLVVGIVVQMKYWSLMPQWYSIAFIILLLPMTVAGGRMAARSSMAGPAAIGA